MSSFSTLRRLTYPLLVVSTASVATAIYGFGFVNLPLSSYGLGPWAIALALLACVSSSALHCMVRWLRWYFLMRRFGRNLPTRLSLKVFFGTLLALLTPFNIGELVRAIPLRKRYASSMQVFWVWLIERWFDTVAIVFLLLVRTQLSTAALLLVIGCVLGFFIERWLPRRASAGWSLGFVALMMALSVTTWCLPVLGLHFVCSRVGLALGPAQAAEVFARSTLWGGVAATPAGAAVAGPVMVLALEGFGVERSVAVLTTSLFRVGTIWLPALVGVLLLLQWGRELLRLSQTSGAINHFDSIADDYLEMIPDHVRDRLLRRKTDAMRARLDRLGIEVGARGLDVGCGQGLYMCDLAAAGYRMSGVDFSQGQVDNASRRVHALGLEVTVKQSSATSLPFADASFDFAYLINVVHHIEGAKARQEALLEIMRVLRPGGVLFLHEMNTQNPLFRFYMGYVFPMLRKIDDGTEEWILPTKLTPVPGQSWSVDIHYFTFLPEFVPPSVLRYFAGFESRLERSRWRRYSAHFMAYVVKSEAAQPARRDSAPAAGT